MNILNQTTIARPVSTANIGLDPLSLYPTGSVFTVIGQLQDRQLGWAGRTHCTLRLSIGDLKVRANRDTLPLDFDNGSWIRAKLIHRHEQDDSPAMHIISAVAASAAPGETSWVPECLYHRIAAMRELRQLLSKLEPALQGLFMSLMLDRRIQRQFFWRPAAADHHVYPGGLFDQCIAAARVAHQGKYADERDRGLATIASLLFDIGKSTNLHLQDDRTRRGPLLQPHPITAWRVKRPLERIALSQPDVAHALSELLIAGTLSGTDSTARRVESIRAEVHRAVEESWGPVESLLDTPPPSEHASINASSAVASTDVSTTEAVLKHGLKAPRQFGARRSKQHFSLEWSSGIVDGEACVHLARQLAKGNRNFTYRLRVYIVQNDLEVLEHFRDGVGMASPDCAGARIYKVKRTPQHNKQVYTLNYEGKKAMALINLLLPHLVRKRAEAVTAQAYWINGCVGTRWGRKGIPPTIAAIRQRAYLKLRSLK